MSLDDYNRGYQSGWTGIATGPPRSAAEFVGHWNGQEERRRAMMPAGSSGASSSGGGDNGHLVLAALFGAAAGGIYAMSFLGAIVGAVAGILAMMAAVWLALRVIRLLIWIYGPLPVVRLALLGGAGTFAAHWVFVTQFGGLLLMGPVAAGIMGALALLLVAGTLRIAFVPVFLMARRAGRRRRASAR